MELAGLRAQEIGFVFQAFHLQESMSAIDNVALGMLYTGQPLKKRREDPRAALLRVGLGHRLEFKPKQLRGGERQRLANRAGHRQAAADHPRREPTGNLDSKSGGQVINLLHELASDGATLVLITHDAEIASGFGRQIQMCDGEVVADERT